VISPVSPRRLPLSTARLEHALAGVLADLLLKSQTTMKQHTPAARLRALLLELTTLPGSLLPTNAGVYVRAGCAGQAQRDPRARSTQLRNLLSVSLATLFLTSPPASSQGTAYTALTNTYRNVTNFNVETTRGMVLRSSLDLI